MCIIISSYVCIYIYCFFLSKILSEFCFFWVIPKAPPFDVVLTAFSSCLEKCPRSASAALRTWRCPLRCFSSAFLGIFLILCPLVKLLPAAQLLHRSTSWVEFEKRNAPNSLKFGGHSTGNFEKKNPQLGRWPSTTTPSNNHRIMLAAYSILSRESWTRPSFVTAAGCGVDRKYTCIPPFDKNNRPIWELETHQGSGHYITNPNFMHYYRRREIPQIYHTFASSLVSTQGESKQKKDVFFLIPKPQGWDVALFRTPHGEVLVSPETADFLRCFRGTPPRGIDVFFGFSEMWFQPMGRRASPSNQHQPF